ncbi:MAG: hypothetical protein ACLFWF_06440 [Alphaproteobacteria bacterium]
MKFPAFIVSGAVLAAILPGTAAAETAVYDCTVAHSAKIKGGHPEASGTQTGPNGGPDSFFAIELSTPEPVAACDEGCRKRQTVREIPPLRKREKTYDLCKSNGRYVLMHPYSAKAVPDEFTVDFEAEEDPGFLRLIGPFDHGESYLFWQSGFEYPGCEDTHLVVRRGECRRRD